MPNLLPPRPGGALAAVSACPDADVIFVAHAGLDTIITVSDVWGKFPSTRSSGLGGGRVPFDEVPHAAEREAQGSSGSTTSGSASTRGSRREPSRRLRGPRGSRPA